MATKPKLKTIVKKNKLVIEISLKTILAEVEVYNQRGIQSFREEGRDPWPLFRVTNAKTYMQYVARRLMTGTECEVESLPDIVSFTIVCNIDRAARQRAGLAKLPWTAQDVVEKQVGKGRRGAG